MRVCVYYYTSPSDRRGLEEGTDRRGTYTCERYGIIRGSGEVLSESFLGIQIGIDLWSIDGYSKALIHLISKIFLHIISKFFSPVVDLILCFASRMKFLLRMSRDWHVYVSMWFHLILPKEIYTCGFDKRARFISAYYRTKLKMRRPNKLVFAYTYVNFFYKMSRYFSILQTKLLRECKIYKNTICK